jgi:hypothetical protein
MQPNSIMIGIGANIGQDKGTDTDLLVAISDAAVSGMNTLFEQPLLQGIKRFTGGYDLPSNVMQTLYGMPASFVPSSLNQLKQLTDNTTRSTYDPSGLGEIAKSVGAKVPGLSLTMQPRVSTSGEDMQAYKGEGWQNNPLNVMMNPAYTSTYNPTPAQEMVMDIYEKTGSKIQFPRLVENYIKWKGEKINLTPEEVTEWQRYVGKETTKRFNQYANNSGFRSQDPEDQAKELEKILTEITKEGKKVTIIDPRGLK